MKFSLIPIVIYSICVLLGSKLLAQSEVVGGIEFDNAQVEINLNDATYPIEILEYSDGLSEWTAVSRNYGNGWESIFPYSYTIDDSNSNLSKLLLPMGEQGFFRKRFEFAIDELSNYELASRFLMQASFGPTLDTIQSFPNVDSGNFIDENYTNFEAWIDQQVAETPFYHRAFWRQRSDPNFSDWSSFSAYLDNEVGHDASLGHRLLFYRGPVQYPPDWGSPLPGHGGLFDINGNPIDPNDYPLDKLDWRGIPRIGMHAENSIAHVGHEWDVIGIHWGDTKKVVWYEAAINAEDQLRQRIAWAMSQYFVVGEEGSNQEGTTERWLNYYDIFVRHAFGNFRDILEEVTWSPHMGYYLSHIENQKADSSKGTFPDENFAREVMQLFTIGLWELNEDGTLELGEGGKAIPTYNNDHIAEFAKVFTGMRRPYDRGNIEIFYGNYIDRMRVQANRHDFSAKTLLDGSILGPFSQTGQGVRDDVSGLLDHLFNHKNMPPFFARFIIQRFTVSNPSPNYIKSVSQAFKTGLYNGSGTGKRGDMVATIKAVLLHPEARESALYFDPSHGKLREPIIRLMHLCRALNFSSLRTYDWICFKGLEDSILQAPYEQSSVFNFYRPDYGPNGAISDSGLTAPEFQITNDVSSLHLLNFFGVLINDGLIKVGDGLFGTMNYADATLDYSYELNLTYNKEALVDHFDLILCGGRLEDHSKQIILNALNSSHFTNLAMVKYALNLFVHLAEFNTLH